MTLELDTHAIAGDSRVVSRRNGLLSIGCLRRAQLLGMPDFNLLVFAYALSVPALVLFVPANPRC